MSEISSSLNVLKMILNLKREYRKIIFIEQQYLNSGFGIEALGFLEIGASPKELDKWF